MYHFPLQVCDLVSWMRDMGGVLHPVEPRRSVSGVEELLTKHNERRAEIDEWEKSYHDYG